MRWRWVTDRRKKPSPFRDGLSRFLVSVHGDPKVSRSLMLPGQVKVLENISTSSNILSSLEIFTEIRVQRGGVGAKIGRGPQNPWQRPLGFVRYDAAEQLMQTGT